MSTIAESLQKIRFLKQRRTCDEVLSLRPTLSDSLYIVELLSLLLAPRVFSYI